MANNVLVGFIIGAGIAVLLLVMFNVLLGQLMTINTNSLGNNSNATQSINQGFGLFSTVIGVVTLVIVMGLLGVAIQSFLGGVLGGGKSR